MLIGFKEQDIELKETMLENEMELYLLKNKYDLGEGICKPGKEHFYCVDSTKVIEYAQELGYHVQLSLLDETFDFVKTIVA